MSTLDELEKLEKAATIPGVAGYVATPDGRVFSTTSNWRGYGPRELKQHPNSHGYPVVRVPWNGRARASVAVHRLVALAFLPPRPTKEHQIRHLDGNRTNNHASNLAWGTVAENAADRDMHGTTARGDRNGSSSPAARALIGERSRNWHRDRPEAQARGERAGLAKLNDAAVMDIRKRRRDGETLKSLATRFGVDQSNISQICRRKTWRHVQ